MKTNSIIVIGALCLFPALANAWENHGLLKSIRPGIYQLTSKVSGSCPKLVWAKADVQNSNFTLTNIDDMDNTYKIFKNWYPIDGNQKEDSCTGAQADFRGIQICVESHNHRSSYTNGQRIYNYYYETGIFFTENQSYEAYVEADGNQLTWYDQQVDGSFSQPASQLEKASECVYQFRADH